jgi:membrane-associated protein
LACVVLTVAAFLGNLAGTSSEGEPGQPSSEERLEDLRQEHVDRTVTFLDRYGNRAIVLARFVPIVRTFITVTTGLGQMRRGRFLGHSGIGALLWASGVTILGSLLGRFDVIRSNIEPILILIVRISVIP